MARLLKLSLLLVALIALFVGQCHGDALSDALFRARKCVARARREKRRHAAASTRERRVRTDSRVPSVARATKAPITAPTRDATTCHCRRSQSLCCCDRAAPLALR